MRRVVALLALFLALSGATGFLVACESDDRGDSASGADQADQGRRLDEERGSRTGFDPASGGEADAGGAANVDLAAPAAESETLAAAPDLPGLGPRIIKTADVRIEVGDDALKESIQDATSIAGRYGGFVLSTTLDGGEDGNGSVLLRIPAGRFEAALADLSDLGEVAQQSVSGEDVGQEYVDLEARLTNYQAQQAVLLRLMDEADTIEETIRVQNELQGVQLQIERIKGRLRYLDDQTTLSTISVGFVTPGAAASEAEPGTLERAWERAGDMVLGVISAVIIGAGIVLPLAILGGIGYFVGLMVMRRVRPAP